VPGIYVWATPHPEWRTAAEAVVSYAVVGEGVVALVDPLLPGENDPEREETLAALDRLVETAERLEICITIPYHTRSAEELYAHYHGRLPTRVWGHAAVRKRFQTDTPLSELPKAKVGEGAEFADGFAQAWAIGNPRRYETPFYFPSHKALAFGDAIVALETGELRVWDQSGGSPDWYERRLLPTLRPLAAIDVERVLVTHGRPLLNGGRKGLQQALTTTPVPSYWQ
jgi:glyoxylase-like metal-dependent hydrolase (beta-lactamase superfamily II)